MSSKQIDPGDAYASEEVDKAVASLLTTNKLNQIAKSISRRFYWFENCASAPTAFELIDEARTKLREGVRKFYKSTVDLADEQSIMPAFVGAVLSCGNGHVKRLKNEVHQVSEYLDGFEYNDELSECEVEPSISGVEPTQGSSNASRLGPEEILELREEHARLERIYPYSKDNVDEFMEFLETKNPAFRRVCELRLAGKKNTEIAAELNIHNKMVGNIVTELKRQATKFFSMPHDDVRDRTRAYQRKNPTA